MGELLRRYWMPACLFAEIPEPGGAPVRVRLLGENLVAFRDTTGRIGLVQENCPHRGASLYFGRNEEAGLRCVYHGWAFDVDGRCVDMPSEPAPFCEKVRMQCLPDPRVRRDRLGLHGAAGDHDALQGLRHRRASTPARSWPPSRTRTCNWVQAMEGNIDTSHISHLHQWDGIDDIPDDGSDKPGYPSNAMSWKFWRHDRAPRLEVDDTWYGYRYAGVRTTPNGNTHVRITAYVVPYTTMVASIPWSAGQGLFIPMDDEPRRATSSRPRCGRTLGLRRREPLRGRAVHHADQPGTAAGSSPRQYTAGNDYQIDREVQRTATFSGVADFVSQDFMVTESMGPIYDRTQEQLGSTDRAITRMRHILISAAKGLAEGKEPPAVAPASTSGPSSARRRSSSRERTGGCSPLSRTPPSPKRSTRVGGTACLRRKTTRS